MTRSTVNINDRKIKM